MLRFLVVLFAAVAVIAATTASIAGTIGRERLNEARPLSETEMAGLLTTMIKGRPGVSALRVEAGDVVFRAGGRDIRMGLAPLGAQFNALPDAKSRQGAYDKLTQRITEAVAGQLSVKTEAERARFIGALIPVMKNRKGCCRRRGTSPFRQNRRSRERSRRPSNCALFFPRSSHRA